MKKGIYVYPEQKHQRHCVRIAGKLTGNGADQKKRFPWRDFLPHDVDKATATPTQWKEARKGAKAAADAWAGERAAVVGTPRQVAFSLTPAQSTDATAAIALLDGKASLVEVVKDYLKRHHPHNRATISELVEKVIEAKKTNKKSTTQSVNPLLRRFAQHVGAETLVSAITPEQIAEFIAPREGFGNNSRRAYLRELRTLFRWAIQRKFAGHNPAMDVEMPRKEAKEICTLTPVQALNFLNVARKEFDAACLAPVALGNFCGIRRDELSRLTWDDVNLADRFVTVRMAASKTSQRRRIKIRDAAVEWLMLCPSKSGPICPQNFEGKFTALTTKAGFIDETGKPAFPRNALRHNFASYLAPVEGLAVVVDELGHSSLKMVREHYRDLKSEREARAFWATKPTTTEAQLTQMLTPPAQQNTATTTTAATA